MGWEDFERGGRGGGWPGDTLYFHSSYTISDWSYLRRARVSLKGLKADGLYDCYIYYIPSQFLTRSNPCLEVGFFFFLFLFNSLITCLEVG